MNKLSIVVALLCGVVLSAQLKSQTVGIGTEVQLQSEILQEERSIMVYLPASYSHTKESYPVMYLLDGGSHFHHASGIVQFLSKQGLIPEMIVVAIKNTNRNRDFSPTKVDRLPKSGGADAFLSFLSDELRPFVDRNYRSQEFKILVGHSFGGAFAVYALLNKPEMFQAYIAISPYLMYDDDALVKMTANQLKSSTNPHWFYMTLGDEPTYEASLKIFSELMQSKAGKGMDFKYVKMEQENHGSVPHLSIYRGLEFIYKDWKLPKPSYEKGISAVDKHFQGLSNKYNYSIVAPEYTMNMLGYVHLQNNEIDKAIKVFKENIRRYPESSNVYDSMGEALEMAKKYEKALTYYKKAVQIASKTKHPNLPVYEQNLKRVKALVDVEQ